MKTRMLVMLLLTALVFGAIFGFKAFGRHMMNSHFEAPPPPVAIATAEVRAYRWPRVLNSVGTFRARDGARLAAEVDGVVAAIRFESGQSVAAGQVLLELEAGVEQGRVAALAAELKLARLERERYRELASRRLVPQSEADLRDSAYERLAAQLAAERALLARKHVRAPFAGRLGIRQISLGDYLKAGDPVVSLQSVDPIHLDFSLPERVQGQVAVGMRVEAELDAWPGQRFSGAIAAIEPEIDAGTRNFRLRAEFANADGRLMPGAFARVRVQAGAAHEVLAVPMTAVRHEPFGDSVFVLNATDGGLVVRQRFVDTGVAQGDLIAIERGLEAGETIAAAGLLKLRNEALVVVNNDILPSAEADPEPDNR